MIILPFNVSIFSVSIFSCIDLIRGFRLSLAQSMRGQSIGVPTGEQSEGLATPAV
jgi:hypothetical protein